MKTTFGGSMFSEKEIQAKLEKLEASLANDTLWLGAAPPEKRIDFLSVLEEGALELHQAGHRAGGDPVWISSMIDAGWPEWLVMLLLSLGYAPSNADESVIGGLKAKGIAFSGSAEQAATYVFVRASLTCLKQVSTPKTARARYVARRLKGGEFSAISCLQSACTQSADAESFLAPIVAKMDEAATKLEQNIELEKSSFYEYWRFFGKALDAAELNSDEHGIEGAKEISGLIDSFRSCLHIDDHTPLNSLYWPKKSAEASWAPEFPDLVAACRESLLWALQSPG